MGEQTVTLLGLTSGTATRRQVLVNESFRGQKVTGQQRYATEIAARLADAEDFGSTAPQGWWAASTLRVWVWVQLILPIRAGGAVLLSMTARAPLWRRRHVLVVHDLFVLTNPEWFSRRYVITHAPLLRAQLRLAKAAVAVSQPVADQLREHYDGPIAVAPNAPSAVFSSVPSTDAEEGDALAARGLAAGSYLLAVGSADPRKNLVSLAAAYGQLSESERAAHALVVVGGSFAFARSEQVAWPSGAVVTGFVSDEELRQLYAGAAAVVFPSRAEGFGLPLVEAAAAGAPSLVVSDLPVFRWICGDGAHFVDPGSVDDIAAGLRAVLSTPTPHRIDLARFDWDESANVIKELCRSVAGSERLDD